MVFHWYVNCIFFPFISNKDEKKKNPARKKSKVQVAGQQPLNIVSRSFVDVKRLGMFFVVRDLRPFHAVAGEGYKTLLQGMGAGVKTPSPDTVKREMVKEYQAKLAVIRGRAAHIMRSSLTAGRTPFMATPTLLSLSSSTALSPTKSSACLYGSSR